MLLAYQQAGRVAYTILQLTMWIQPSLALGLVRHGSMDEAWVKART